MYRNKKTGEVISDQEYQQKFGGVQATSQQSSENTFLNRLKLGFGTKEEQSQIQEPKGFLKGGLSEIPKDIADVAGKALPLTGMLVGGILGSAANLPGAIAGAGVGAGMGEKLRQDIGTGLGLQKAPLKERVSEVGKEALAGAGGEVGGRILGAVAKPIVSKIASPIIKNAKNIFKDMVSVMTSVPEKAIERAATDASTKGGFNEAVNATTIRGEAINAYNAVRKEMQQKFSNGLETLKNKYRTGISFFPNIQLTKQVNDAVKGVPSIFREFRIGVKKNILDFSKSAVVKGGEQKNLQAVFDTIKNQKDFSVQGIEDTAARINALSKFTEGIKTESSVIIAKIHDTYSRAIEKSFPELGKLRKEYAITSQMLKNANDVLNATKNKDTKAIRSSVSKLTNLFKEDNDIYINSLMALEKASGAEFLSKLAGTEFQRTMPGILRTSVAIGGLATLFHSPTALLIAPLFSPRFWGETLVKKAQAGKILEGIFKNFMGVSALDSATKAIINEIIKGKL